MMAPLAAKVQLLTSHLDGGEGEVREGEGKVR